VTEAKSSALLPSLVEGLAARGASRIGNVVLPWRWFARGGGGGGKGEGDEAAGGGGGGVEGRK
jgi:hypothetical protein